VHAHGGCYLGAEQISQALLDNLTRSRSLKWFVKEDDVYCDVYVRDSKCVGTQS
jgi:hypothetical protein